MHLNRWKSVLVAWANALEVTPTTINFIEDLSPDFFVKLCSFLKQTDVSSLQEAVTYITDYYKSLVLGNEEDDNYVALLATAYLLFTSVHKTNDELCKRLCSVSNIEQAAIKSALEAFVDVQPPKITKDLMFMTLAQLPDGLESFGNSPYLTSSDSNSPGMDGDTPSRTGRRSSRFKRVKHQLHMTLTIKNSLQEELDSARETISNLESVLLVKNQDIAQLKERCHRLLNDREEYKSRESPRCRTPTGDGRDCGKCRALERQISTYQESDLQNKSDIDELKESLAALNKKISKLELEKRSMDDQLRLYEEQILKNNDDISALKFQREDALKNNKELESIIEELRDAKSKADCSVDSVLPENLGNEVIDLQLSELRLALDEKIDIIYDRDEEISGLKAKLSEESSRVALLEDETTMNQSTIQGMLQENELCNAKILELRKDFEKLTCDYQLTCTELSDARKLKDDVEKQLQTSRFDAMNLSEEIRSLRKDLLVMESLKIELEKRCCELKDIIAKKEENISSLELESKRSTESLQQEVDANVTLNEQCKTLQSILTEESAKVCSLKDDILRTQSVIQEMLREKEMSDANILSLQNDVERLEQEHKLTSIQLVDAQNIIISMKQQLHESQQRCTTLTDGLAKQEEALQKLEFSHQNQGKELQEKSEKLSSLVDEIAHLTADIQQEQQLKEVLNQEMEMEKLKYEKSCFELQTIVAMKDANISSLEQEIKSLTETLQREVNITASLKDDVKTLQSTLAEKHAEVGVLGEQILKNKSLIQGLQREKDSCSAMILNLQNDIEKLTGDYQRSTADLVIAQNTKTDLEQELQANQQRIAKLSEDLEKEKAELKQMKSSYLEQEEMLSNKNMQLASLENEVAHLTAAVKQEQQSNEVLSQKIETQQSELVKICNQVEEANAIQDEMRRTFGEEAKRLTELWKLEKDANICVTEECESLKLSLTEKSTKIVTLKEEISRNQSEIREKVQEEELLSARLLASQNEIQKLTEEYQMTSARLADEQQIKNDIEQQIRESQLHIATLYEDLEKQGKEVHKLKSSFTEQEEVLMAKNEELSSLKNEVALLTSAVREERQSNEVLSEKIETQKLEFEKICNQLEKANAMQDEMTCTFGEEANRLKELWKVEKDANVCLKEECETLQSSLAEKSVKISALEEEISRNQSVIQEKLQEEELLSSRLLDSQNEIQKLTEGYQMTSARLTDEQKMKKYIEQQLQESQIHIKTLSEDLEKQGNEVEKLKCSFTEQEGVLMAKNEELSSLKNEVALLTAAAREEHQSNEMLSEKIETQKLEFEKICNQLEKANAMQDEMICTFGEEANRLKELWKVEKDANVCLKEECETLQSSLGEKSVKISALEEEISRNQSVIREKLQEKELLSSRLLDSQNEIQKLTEGYQMTSARLADEQKMKKNIEQQLRESQIHIKTLSEDLEKQGKEVEKLKCSFTEQEGVLMAKNEELSSLKNEVALLTAAAREGHQSNEMLSQTIETQKIELEKICSQLEEANAMQDDMRRTFGEEANRLTELWKVVMDANVCLKEECETLQSSLTEKSVKIATLEEEILRNLSVIQEKVNEEELLSARLFDSQNEIKKLTEEHQLTSARLADEQKMKNDIKQQLEQSQLHIATLSENLEKQGNKVQKLECIYAEQEEVLTAKNEKLSSLENEVAQLTEAVRQVRDLNEVLAQEMETQKFGFEKRSEELEATISMRDENIDSLEQEANRLTDTLKREVDTTASLKEEVKTLQSTMTEKCGEIAVLEDEILKYKSTIQEMRLEKEKSYENILSLQNEVERLTADHQLTTALLVDVRNINDDAEKRLQESLIKNTTLSESLANQEKVLLALELLRKEQENILTVKNEKLSSMESQLAQCESNKQEMEKENLKCKETIHALEADLLKFTQSNEVTDAKLLKILEQKNSLEERLTVLKKELKEKEDHEGKLNLDLMTLQRELNEAKSLVSTLKEAEKSSEIIKKEYEMEKDNTQTVIRSLQGEVERLTNENSLATSRASSLVHETESLNRRLDNCCMDLDIKNETIMMMDTTISLLNKKIDMLEAGMKEKDCAITSAKADLSDAKAALEKYREEVQGTTDRRIEELTEAVRQRDNENETLSERLAFLSEELLQVSQTFNTEKTSLMDHAKNLEDMLESAKSAEDRLESEIVSLKGQLRTKELKLSQVEEKMPLILDLHKCEKREWTTKNKCLQTQLDEYKIKCDHLLKDLEARNVEQLIGKISRLETESQELRDKLELKLKDIQWYAHELEVLQKSASNTMKVNKQLEEEVESLTKSKLREVTRLEKEVASLTEKTKQLGSAHASDISAKLRQEYEEKLERLKAKMRKVYTEKMETMMKYQTGDEKVYADEELRKEKQKRHALESRVRELSDQLLIVQEEKRALISNNIFRTPAYPLGGGPIANPAYESPPLHKAQSLDRLPVPSYGLDNFGADHLDQSCIQHNNLEQSFSSRRTSTSSNRSSHLPKGIGKVFPAAEEDGEVFDNRCLADLKDGVCRLPGPGGADDRMSILQQRNSMCPPHLKSSYPVESQFFAPNAKEDEIKLQANAKANKENQPQDARSVPGTPSKLRALFSGSRRRH